MLVLGNDDAQTVRPGQAVTFAREVIPAGRECSHGEGGAAVSLVRTGLYGVHFRANVSGAPHCVAALAIEYGGDVLLETVMEAAVNDYSDEYGVSAATAVRKRRSVPGTLFVRNVGESEIELTSPCLMIGRI